jgi:hypothetical protein
MMAGYSGLHSISENANTPYIVIRLERDLPPFDRKVGMKAFFIYLMMKSIWAYPDLFVTRISKSCSDQPTRRYDGHGSPIQDS